MPSQRLSFCILIRIGLLAHALESLWGDSAERLIFAINPAEMKADLLDLSPNEMPGSIGTR